MANYGGYKNSQEWLEKDPDGYNKHYDAMADDMKFKLDGSFAAKIASIKVDPNDKFADAIERACKGELTNEEMAICKDKGGMDISAPPLPPKKWYARLWDWVKGFFVKQKTMDDFKQYEPGEDKPWESKINTTPRRISGPNVELNEEFDFQEWVFERRDRILKAIKEDGKEENTITCPVCYKDREYYIAKGNKHIHSSCKGCGITLMQ